MPESALLGVHFWLVAGRFTLSPLNSDMTYLPTERGASVPEAYVPKRADNSKSVKKASNLPALLHGCSAMEHAQLRCVWLANQ